MALRYDNLATAPESVAGAATAGVGEEFANTAVALEVEPSGDQPGESEESSSEEYAGPRNCLRQGLPLIAGLAFLGLFGVLVAVGSHPFGSRPSGGQDLAAATAASPLSSSGHGEMSARALFESRRLAEVATDSLLVVGHVNMTTEDREAVQGHIHRALLQASESMASHTPALARRLEGLRLSSEEQEAALRVMRRMQDPRVQRVGRGIAAAAAREASHADREAVKHGLAQHLGSHFRQLRQLRELVMPAPLHRRRGGPGSWRVRVEPERLRLLKSFDHWHMELEISRPHEIAPASPTAAPSAPAVRDPAAALEGPLVRQTGRRLTSPLQVLAFVTPTGTINHIQETATGYLHRFTSVMGAFTDVPEVLSTDFHKLTQCGMKQLTRMHLMSAWSCSTQYANTAMDAVEDLFDTAWHGEESTTSVKPVEASAGSQPFPR